MDHDDHPHKTMTWHEPSKSFLGSFKRCLIRVFVTWRTITNRMKRYSWKRDVYEAARHTKELYLLEASMIYFYWGLCSSTYVVHKYQRVSIASMSLGRRGCKGDGVLRPWLGCCNSSCRRHCISWPCWFSCSPPLLFLLEGRIWLLRFFFFTQLNSILWGLEKRMLYISFVKGESQG